MVAINETICFTQYTLQFVLPDKQNIGFTLIGLGHGATEVPLSVFNVRLLVKDLDEVEVAVVGLLQLIQWELEVDLLLLLGANDPGAVNGGAPLPRVIQMLLGYIRSS